MKKKEKLKNEIALDLTKNEMINSVLTLNRQIIANLNLILNSNEYFANKVATTTCLSAKNTGCPTGVPPAPEPTPTPKDTIYV